MKLKRANILTIAVILALMVYAGVTLSSLKDRVSDANAEKARLEGEILDLQQSNAELEYELENAEDPATIEGIARDKLGLVRPGEKIFYDVNG